MKKISIFICLFSLLGFGCTKEENKGSTPDGNGTNGKSTSIFNTSLNYGTMTDQDGNTYNTITIGSQTWMAENLRTTKYNDGTSIPNVKLNTEWTTQTAGTYCNYSNTEKTDSIATIGRLYNWLAVNSGILAPKGWHIPSDTEWKALVDYLGGTTLAGPKMKETGAVHWKSPNTDATNESGFTAIPSGNRHSGTGIFNGDGTTFNTHCNWWCSNSNKFADINYNVPSTNISYGSTNSKYGMAVRCVKD